MVESPFRGIYCNGGARIILPPRHELFLPVLVAAEAKSYRVLSASVDDSNFKLRRTLFPGQQHGLVGSYLGDVAIPVLVHLSHEAVYSLAAVLDVLRRGYSPEGTVVDVLSGPAIPS